MPGNPVQAQSATARFTATLAKPFELWSKSLRYFGRAKWLQRFVARDTARLSSYQGNDDELLRVFDAAVQGRVAAPQQGLLGRGFFTTPGISTELLFMAVAQKLQTLRRRGAHADWKKFDSDFLAICGHFPGFCQEVFGGLFDEPHPSRKTVEWSISGDTRQNFGRTVAHAKAQVMQYCLGNRALCRLLKHHVWTALEFSEQTISAAIGQKPGLLTGLLRTIFSRARLGKRVWLHRKGIGWFYAPRLGQFWRDVQKQPQNRQGLRYVDQHAGPAFIEETRKPKELEKVYPREVGSAAKRLQGSAKRFPAVETLRDILEGRVKRGALTLAEVVAILQQLGKKAPELGGKRALLNGAKKRAQARAIFDGDPTGLLEAACISDPKLGKWWMTPAGIAAMYAKLHPRQPTAASVADDGASAGAAAAANDDAAATASGSGSAGSASADSGEQDDSPTAQWLRDQVLHTPLLRPDLPRDLSGWEKYLSASGEEALSFPMVLSAVLALKDKAPRLAPHPFLFGKKKAKAKEDALCARDPSGLLRAIFDSAYGEHDVEKAGKTNQWWATPEGLAQVVLYGLYNDGDNNIGNAEFVGLKGGSIGDDAAHNHAIQVLGQRVAAAKRLTLRADGVNTEAFERLVLESLPADQLYSACCLSPELTEKVLQNGPACARLREYFARAAHTWEKIRKAVLNPVTPIPAIDLALMPTDWVYELIHSTPVNVAAGQMNRAGVVARLDTSPAEEQSSPVQRLLADELFLNPDSIGKDKLEVLRALSKVDLHRVVDILLAVVNSEQQPQTVKDCARKILLSDVSMLRELAGRPEVRLNAWRQQLLYVVKEQAQREREGKAEHSTSTAADLVNAHPTVKCVLRTAVQQLCSRANVPLDDLDLAGCVELFQNDAVRREIFVDFHSMPVMFNALMRAYGPRVMQILFNETRFEPRAQAEEHAAEPREGHAFEHLFRTDPDATLRFVCGVDLLCLLEYSVGRTDLAKRLDPDDEEWDETKKGVKFSMKYDDFFRLF